MNLLIVSIGQSAGTRPVSWSNITSENWADCLVGFGIVFLVLTLMVVLFSLMPKVFAFFREKKENKAHKAQLSAQGKEDETPVTVYQNTAIATAIYLYYNSAHEEESNVVTIKRVERRYSPWSSKIYGVRSGVR